MSVVPSLIAELEQHGANAHRKVQQVAILKASAHLSAAQETWSHFDVATCIGRWVDELQAEYDGLGGSEEVAHLRRRARRDLAGARTALTHVLSDLETGSSLASWPDPSHLVDVVVADALGVASVNIIWEPI